MWTKTPDPSGLAFWINGPQHAMRARTNRRTTINQNLKPYLSLNDFAEAAMALERTWTAERDVAAHDDANEGYPFALSFEEETFEIVTWCRKAVSKISARANGQPVCVWPALRAGHTHRVVLDRKRVRAVARTFSFIAGDSLSRAKARLLCRFRCVEGDGIRWSY